MRDYTCSEANDLVGFRSALFLTPPTLEGHSTKSQPSEKGELTSTHFSSSHLSKSKGLTNANWSERVEQMSTLTHNHSVKSLIEKRRTKNTIKRLTPQQSKADLNSSFNDSELPSNISEDLYRLIDSDEDEAKATLTKATASLLDTNTKAFYPDEKPARKFSA